MFLGLSFYAWITVATIASVIIVMIRTRIPVEITFLGALTVLLVTGVVSEEEGMEGFASEPVMVHAAFFVVIAGLIHTGAIYWLTQHVFGNPKNYRHAIYRVMVPVSILSALLNGINVVAMTIDAVKIWARRLSISPSKLLVPLSCAATMGGICTLMGSTSNLVIAGLYAEKTGRLLGVFEPLLPGVVLTAIATFLVVALRRLIPNRESPEISFETTSDYTVELLVPTDNPAVGMTVAEAGLKNVKGGSLIEIVRFDKEIIMPVGDDEFILGGDRLVFAGQISDILELKRTNGLVAADHHVYSIDEIDNNRKLRTAYVTFGSDLIGTSMSTNHFERDTEMVLVAVARGGKRVDGQPREIRLQAGDSLLLECPPKSDDQLEKAGRRNLAFFDSHFVPQTGPRTITAGAILVLMFVLSSFNIRPLWVSTMLAAALMMATKCCRMRSLTKYIEWDLLLILGATVVFSTAVTKTGVAATLATHMLRICGQNPHVVLAAMCLLALITSELVGRVGTSAIFFPIAWHEAATLGCNPMTFIMGLMLTVNLSLVTPMGSTTNMLIFGPGGFRFGDFARLGICLQVVLFITTFVIVNILYPM
ncbi:MAG: SLC13 family permease [Prevotella sp.]|nr:SLC13 family permease [Prevotella sp.]